MKNVWHLIAKKNKFIQSENVYYDLTLHKHLSRDDHEASGVAKSDTPFFLIKYLFDYFTSVMSCSIDYVEGKWWLKTDDVNRRRFISNSLNVDNAVCLKYFYFKHFLHLEALIRTLALANI